MIFIDNEFEIDIIIEDDYKRICEIYNSNQKFLNKHLKVRQIDESWLKNEIRIMKELNFLSCKIRKDNEIIGLIDFSVDEDSYISLMMIDEIYKNQGIGKYVFEVIEKYIKLNDSKKIKLDVVKDYDEKVIEFWERNGFVKIKEVELNWNKNILTAFNMEKLI